MEIKTEVTRTFLTSDGKALQVGQKVIYDTIDGKCYSGIFNGIGKQGNLEFKSLIKKDVYFGVRPTNIATLFVANIDIMED